MDDFLAFDEVYTSTQKEQIANEFRRLGDNTYLDHASATLYSERQIQHSLNDLSANIYANPHSMNISGKLTEDAIDIARYCILDLYNTNSEEYTVIFTSGATGAIKIVAECFDYGEEEEGILVHLENNHTSVLGMRCYAKNSAEIKVVDAFNVFRQSKDVHGIPYRKGNNLFVYPAQCNFSGTKFPLEWISKAKDGSLNHINNGNWYVLVDSAAYTSTNPLDLSKYKPDFVPVSFYKMFGYPTGLGALLVKKSAESVLKKRYFGGGTVLMALSSSNVMIPRKSFHERFEDGTIPFTSILAVKHGLDVLKRLNINFDIISKHVFSLARYVYRHLLILHHSNGKPAAILHHDTIFDNRDDQGGIVNFSLVRSNGNHVGYSEVLHMANLHKIHLRTGCFCNPGACKRYLKLRDIDVVKHFEAGHVCGDQHDLIDGYPTGTIRISFGYMSTKEDADNLLKMIETCFVDSPVVRKLPLNWERIQENYQRLFQNGIQFINGLEDTLLKRHNDNYSGEKDLQHNNEQTKYNQGILQQIMVYPIKSCGAFVAPTKWPLSKRGFKFDREWMITNTQGVCLTQKHSKKLCLIVPTIDMEANVMKLSFKGHPSIVMDLDNLSDTKKIYLCQSKICKDRVQGWDCGDEISNWLSECLEIPGVRLLRQCEEEEYPSEDAVPKISFANKAQFLLINSTTVKWLTDKIPRQDLNEDLNSVIQRFRPNLVVKLEKPFQENEIDEILFDGMRFKAAGKCTRCQMICVNQRTGETSKEPLLTLSRELKGKLYFGVYLNFVLQHDNCDLQVGSKLIF